LNSGAFVKAAIVIPDGFGIIYGIAQVRELIRSKVLLFGTVTTAIMQAFGEPVGSQKPPG
jgi:hypothetical protein